MAPGWKSGRKPELADRVVRAVFQSLEKWLFERVAEPPIHWYTQTAAQSFTSSVTQDWVPNVLVLDQPEGKITFDGTSTYTPAAGVWEVSFIILWAFNATGYRRVEMIYTGPTTVTVSTVQAAAAVATVQTAQITVEANGTNTYKFTGRQNSGGALNGTIQEIKWKWISE